MAKKTHEQFMKDFHEKNIYAKDIEILGKYNGAREKIDCECLIDGYQWSPLAGNLLSNHGCPECAIRKRNESNTKTHEQFIKEFYKKNPYAKNIKIKSDYNGIEERMYCECKVCSHEWSPTADSLLNSKRGCPICAIRNRSGENSYMWNPNLTDEERELDRHIDGYSEFRTNVYIEDNRTCQCCGQHGGKLNAHHLNGYHWFIEGRLDINNAITLCEDCHKEFHHIYGYRNNTKEQFEEFISYLLNEKRYIYFLENKNNRFNILLDLRDII